MIVNPRESHHQQQNQPESIIIIISSRHFMLQVLWSTGSSISGGCMITNSQWTSCVNISIFVMDESYSRSCIYFRTENANIWRRFNAFL